MRFRFGDESSGCSASDLAEEDGPHEEEAAEWMKVKPKNPLFDDYREEVNYTSRASRRDDDGD